MAAVVLFLCFFTSFVVVSSDVLCENGFCRTHLLDAKNRCASTAPDCRYNNATHSGLNLPSPSLCNCCEYCLPLYQQNQDCSIGGPGDGITIGRCGHGLMCDEDTRKCVRMKTKCHDLQDDYDERFSRGEVGAFEKRPYCDEKGKFAAFHCVPTQSCFCQSEDGERLFGEVLYTGPLQNMPCGCSRFHEQIKKIIDRKVQFPVAGPKCTSDGNFNPVQCVGRSCFCVNRITGERVGSNSIHLDEQKISDLSCYNEDLDLFPELFEGEPPYNYTTPCFMNIENKKKIIKESEEAGFIMDYFNTFDDMECLPDGTSSRVGRTANGSKICMNERSVRIGDYEAHPNTPEYKSMDCKCALTSSLMSSQASRPVCCKNGNFRPIQCYRGVCRCVDSDGRQVGKEQQNVRSLPCFTQDWQHC
ncbi:unnamed protein product [Colias eurytheme]|nr:unnamed protein product [Colias eurytheme]